MLCWHKALAVLLASSIAVANASLSDERRSQIPRRQLHAQVQTGTRRPDGLQPDDPWIEHLSWKPRAWLYHNFMTAEECDHIIELARPSMARSTVVDSETGDSVLDPIRTSQGTFLSRYQDAVVRDIEDRMAHWTHLPATYGEDLQVLKYEPGQKYEEHWDAFEKEEIEKMGMDDTNRIATVLVYLSDVEEGGETAFSKSSWLNQTVQQTSMPSECAAAKVFAKPHKGDALLFWDLKPDGQTIDKWSMHAGCPVLKGEKWSATKWYHNGEYGDTSEMTRLAAQFAKMKCEDRDASCPDWAARGDCVKNKRYMVGTFKRPGHCLVSCNACVACAPGDLVCQRKSERMRKSALKRD